MMMVKSGLLCLMILCVSGRFVDGGAVNEELANELRQVLRDLKQEDALNNERRQAPVESNPVEDSPPSEEQIDRNKLIDKILMRNRADLEQLSTAELVELSTQQEEEFGGASSSSVDNTSEMTNEEVDDLVTEETVEEETETTEEEETGTTEGEETETERSEIENTVMDEGELATKMKKEAILKLLKRLIERK
ncbi:hypothetical protein SNE40_022085 [Patella caerulea]|uniref:Uncharacterized protein n=2 Tax=Patella caerulea TaxID=87958 RepID=A0AAN8G5P8_PATCE